MAHLSMIIEGATEKESQLITLLKPFYSKIFVLTNITNCITLLKGKDT